MPATPVAAGTDGSPAPATPVAADTDASDPTADMRLVVTDVTGQITASGTCAVTLTVDGSHTYKFKGTWTATFTWNGASFGGTHTKSDCEAAQA